MERLRGALAIAAAVPAELRQELASDTLKRIALADGSWTVLWHSIVRQYLDDEQRAAVSEGIGALGATATASARFAWLCLEPQRRTLNGECLVTLTTWPGGDPARTRLRAPARGAGHLAAGLTAARYPGRPGPIGGSRSRRARLVAVRVVSRAPA